MGIVMYMIDERYPIQEIKPGLHGSKTVRKVIVGQRTPLPEAVQMTLDEMKAGEKIELLRMCAHGNSGGLILGSGLAQGNVMGLEPLGKVMDGNSSRKVELHGCGVASDTSILKDGADPIHPKLADVLPGTYSGQRVLGNGGRGFMLLLSVAWCTKSKVRGAVNIQVANPSFFYQGKTVLVDPDGTTEFSDSRDPGTKPAMVPDAK